LESQTGGESQVTITLNESELEQLLSYFDEFGEISEKAKAFIANKFQFSKTNQTTDIDTSRITFKVKGGAEAGPNDKWGWAWARAQNGSYHDESRALVQYLEQYGEMTQGGFTYSLSKDGKFLNRKKV